MLHKTEILFTANDQNFLEKEKFATSVQQKHQDAQVVIILVSNQHISSDKDPGLDEVVTIHYPSNRPIETHVLLMQRIKLNPSGTVVFLHKPPRLDSLNTSAEQLISNVEQKVGLVLNNQQELRALKRDPNHINNLRLRCSALKA